MADKTRPDELGQYGSVWDLIPLHRWDAKGKRGQPVGKAPQDSGWRKRTYDRATIKAHIAAGGNVGVRLRHCDLVLDVDPRNFPEGRDCLAELVAATGLDLARYPHVVTGSGGDHYYMRKDPQALLRATIPDFPGIELKTHGVQVVSAGSVHPNGRNYRWDELAPELAEIVEAPERLLGLFRRPRRPPTVGGGELTTEQLEGLLALLDPCEFAEHDRWLRLMMACHHATDGAGMDEFLDWSTGDPAFAGRRGENARRWDSLHGQGGAAGASVTVGTLYREILAVVDGEGQPRHADRIPKGAAADDFPDMAPGEAEGPSRPMGPLQELNQDHWAVDAGGKFRIFKKVEEPVGEGLPSRKAWRVYGPYDFEKLHGNRRIPVADQKQPVPLGKAWIEWILRRTARGVIFDPEREWPGYLNLWQGFAVEPRKGDWSLMQELIRDVLCSGNRDHERYVLDWLAHCVQHPGQRAEVALVFRGDKGTGKGTLGRAMRDLFGVHGLHISSPGHLTGRFNAHLRDCVLMFADEAFWAGDKASESVLKQLITESTMMYEAKGLNAESDQNRIHIVIASNDQWVVPAGINGERRFAVFDVSNARQGQKAGFFEPLNRQLRRGGLEAMLFDLLARDIEGKHPRDNIPTTSAMTEQKERSLDPIATWWLERLHEGTLASVEGKPWEGHRLVVLAADMQASVEQFLKSMGARPSRRSVGTQLGQELKHLIPDLRKVKAMVPDERLDVDRQTDGRAYAYEVPTLKECRDHFALKLLQDPSYRWSAPSASDDAWLS